MQAGLARTAEPGMLGSSDIAGEGERKLLVIFLRVTISSRPSARPSRPAVHRRLCSPASTPGPIPRKPEARTGAGLAGAARPAGGQDRTPPVASPDGVFLPSSSLSPSDLNFPKPRCASAPERRTRGRRVGDVAPRAASKPGPGFVPDPARFSAAVAVTVSIFVHLLHASSTGEKDSGRRGQPTGATRRAAPQGAETGGARLCGVGRRCGLRAGHVSCLYVRQICQMRKI